MEKLYELHDDEPTFDLVVVDTPPTRTRSTSSTRPGA